jgi:hypothetical protein
VLRPYESLNEKQKRLDKKGTAPVSDLDNVVHVLSNVNTDRMQK